MKDILWLILDDARNLYAGIAGCLRAQGVPQHLIIPNKAIEDVHGYAEIIEALRSPREEPSPPFCVLLLDVLLPFEEVDVNELRTQFSELEFGEEHSDLLGRLSTALGSRFATNLWPAIACVHAASRSRRFKDTVVCVTSIYGEHVISYLRRRFTGSGVVCAHLHFVMGVLDSNPHNDSNKQVIASVRERLGFREETQYTEAVSIIEQVVDCAKAIFPFDDVVHGLPAHQDLSHARDVLLPRFGSGPDWTSVFSSILPRGISHRIAPALAESIDWGPSADGRYQRVLCTIKLLWKLMLPVSWINTALGGTNQGEGCQCFGVATRHHSEALLNIINTVAAFGALRAAGTSGSCEVHDISENTGRGFAVVTIRIPVDLGKGSNGPRTLLRIIEDAAGGRASGSGGMSRLFITLFACLGYVRGSDQLHSRLDGTELGITLKLPCEPVS